MLSKFFCEKVKIVKQKCQVHLRTLLCAFSQDNHEDFIKILTDSIFKKVTFRHVEQTSSDKKLLFIIWSI